MVVHHWTNFGSSSSLPPLVSECCGLVCKSVGKADRLPYHFDGMQSREAADLPLTCRPSPSLTTSDFRSREVWRLVLDFDPYGSTDPLGMFLLLLMRTADVMAPILEQCFGGLFVWVVYRLAGDRQMLPQFRRVDRLPLLPITDRLS